MYAKESGLPLQQGSVRLGDKVFAIVNGEFFVESIQPGKYKVTIDGPFRQAKETTIIVKNGLNKLTFNVETNLSQSEIDLLAKITRAEAEGESELGKVAVAATVLNRVLSPKYPSSVKEVVYQRINGRTQYSPVRDGRINLSPRRQDYEAAYQALAGNDPSNGATGFFNPAKTKDAWVHSRPVTTRIGGHTFFSY